MLKLRKGVCAIVYRKHGSKIEFLLLHRVLHWKGWEFPKGGSDKGETLQQALHRELKEELGLSGKQILKVKRIPFCLEFDDFIRKKHHKNYAFVVEVSPEFKASISKNIDAEHSSFRWLSGKNALRLLSFKESKRLFKASKKFIS